MTALPLIPIQFKVAGDASLFYTVPEDERTEPGGITTRQIEGVMVNFEPVRFFQLRHGIQEFLFRYRGVDEPLEGDAADPGSVEVPEI